jgi:hypothetical protein
MAVTQRILTRVILEEIHPFVSSSLPFLSPVEGMGFLRDTEAAFRDQWRWPLFLQWTATATETETVSYEIEEAGVYVVLPLPLPSS